MDIQSISQDKDMVKKLTTIRDKLQSLFNNDNDIDRYRYEERDLPLGVNHLAVNERVAKNRLAKIVALKSLSENWDTFKIYFKNDSFMDKLGEEFIKGKLKFDDRILKEIKEYPFKKQVLNYFPKNITPEMPEVTGADYEKFKAQIFPEIEKNAIKHIERKEALLKALRTITEDKSQDNLEKMWTLHGSSHLGTVEGEVGTFIGKVMANIKLGDFKYEQSGSKMTIQVPIPGTIESNGVKEKISSSIFSVDLNNPKEYSMQVGTLDKPKMSIEDRIKGMRNNAFKKPHDPGFKIV